MYRDELHLAYRWFCKLHPDDEIPHHSTQSANRLAIFERVVLTAMAIGLVKGEGFAVDVSVLKANASRYNDKPPEYSNGATSRASGAPSLLVERPLT